LDEELRTLQDRHLYRKVRAIDRTGAVRGILDGRSLCLFCGNDYLGLSFHPEVVGALIEGARRYGAGAGAARLTSGHASVHAALEARLAAVKNKENALVYSTGYLANLGILTALAGPEDLVVMDKLCHASMVDAARLSGAAIRVYPHRLYRRCEEILKRSPGFRRKILVTESVFSMDGDTADIAELIRLKEKFGCLLVVDDAHGTGVLGRRGGGAAEDPAQSEKIDVVMGTLSKALGCLGGYAAASSKMIDYLTNFSRPFIFTTALPPALCAAALAAVDVLERNPGLFESLWRHVRRMREGLTAAGLSYEPSESPIFPVMTGDEAEALRLSQTLLEAGFLVPAIRYPTVPKGKARLRLTVSAAHSDDDIDAFLAALRCSLKSI
jgi:8-amino-7-oxononanoate synthase